MLKSFFIILIAFVGFFQPVHAFGEETYPGRWWHVPQASKMLELSDGEKQQLDRLYDENRNKLRELRDSVEDERERLYKVLDKDAFSEEDVSGQLRKLELARAKLSAERIRYIVEVRKLLGLERFQTLKQFYKRSRDGRLGEDRRLGDRGNFDIHLGPGLLNFRFHLW
jgi:Spy/CpxP family protein refolding chaperone